MIPRKMVERTLRRFYNSHRTEVGIKPYQSATKDVYGEEGTKSYGLPTLFNAYLEMDPTELRLRDIGWTKDPIEIIVRVPYSILQDVNLADNANNLSFDTDDRLYVKTMDEDFTISRIQRKEPFVNGLPTYVWLGGRRIPYGKA